MLGRMVYNSGKYPYLGLYYRGVNGGPILGRGAVMSRLLVNILMLLLPRFLPQLIRYGLLVWRLTFDRRVSIFLRALVPLALVYLVLPWGLVPDRTPILGWMDDLIILGLALFLLLKLAPGAVVDEHLGRAPPSERPEDKDPSKVVDGKARFLDQE